MNPPEGNFYDILKANAAYSSFFKYINLAQIPELMQKQAHMTCEYLQVLPFKIWYLEIKESNFLFKEQRDLASLSIKSARIV